ncbi:MAG: DegT/DnrJ/EryC1/StrS family aminotransferase [Candidatus Omnitrophota bacterium]
MADKLAILGGKKTREKPFVKYAIIGDEEKSRVKEVLDSGILSGFIARAGDNFLGGKQVKELEALVNSYFSCRNAVTVNSATAGLHVALAACGIGPGDEVIVTPYTMCASATAVVMQNAVPVFADISDDDFCLDPESIEQRLTDRVKAIVVVHLFGYPAKMDEIMAIAKKRGLYVIEDCAQAPGALYKGRPVGTIGDIGVFSLNQHKTITCGEGGFAITDDDDLALRMRLIRNHGEVITDDMEMENIDNIVGFNYRMTELEGAVSVGQFKRLDQLNDQRIKLAEYLASGLSKFKGLRLPLKEKGNKHVYFVFPIRYDREEVGVPRDIFVKAVNEEGIPLAAGYVRPIYMEPLYRKKIAYGRKGCPFTCSFYGRQTRYEKGICPVTERMYEEELILTPVCKYPHTIEDMDDVIKAFEKVFNNIGELKKSIKNGVLPVR